MRENELTANQRAAVNAAASPGAGNPFATIADITGSGGFDFTQASPSVEWIVNHNLGFKPTVEVFSVGGQEIETDVIHVTINQVRIYFITPTAGEARCV